MRTQIIIGALITSGVALGLYLANRPVEMMTDQAPPSPTPTNMEQQMITLGEVAVHNSKEDCYMAIEGKVYDVTEYAKSGWHPGKEAILMGCGTDATAIFNKRPVQGTSHSEAARKMLGKYEIGTLATE